MKDEQTLILIESINMNPNLDASQKLELVAKTMMDCKQKKIGKIITDAIEAKKYYPNGPLKNPKDTMDGFEGDTVVSTTPKKRGRGRPRKNERTPNQQKMLQTIRADSEGRY